MTNDKIQNIGGDMIINSVYEIGKSLITNMITTGNGIDNYNNYILNYVNANYYRDINFNSLQELSISRDGFRSIYRNINKGNYRDAFKVALIEMGFNSYADELSEEFVKELPTLIDMSKSSEDIIAELKEENEALRKKIDELKAIIKSLKVSSDITECSITVHDNNSNEDYEYEDIYAVMTDKTLDYSLRNRLKGEMKPEKIESFKAMVAKYKNTFRHSDKTRISECNYILTFNTK